MLFFFFFFSFLTWNHTFLVSANPERVKIFLCLNKNDVLGICGRIVDTDASKRSSADPWRELWHGQDGWGARGKPRTPESEYSWAVRCARPRFLMMGKSQSCSICCQRWRRSRRQAVISDKAFLWKDAKEHLNMIKKNKLTLELGGDIINSLCLKDFMVDLV